MTSLQEGLNGLRKRRLIDIPSIKIHFSSHGYVSPDVYLVRLTFFFVPPLDFNFALVTVFILSIKIAKLLDKSQ